MKRSIISDRDHDQLDLVGLAQQVKVWGAELGLHGVGITDCDLSTAQAELLIWLAKGFHDEMNYMAKYGSKPT